MLSTILIGRSKFQKWGRNPEKSPLRQPGVWGRVKLRSLYELVAGGRYLTGTESFWRYFWSSVIRQLSTVLSLLQPRDGASDH